MNKLEDLPEFTLKEIANFFQNYKVLQSVTVEVGDYHSMEDDIRIIGECRRRFMDDTAAE